MAQGHNKEDAPVKKVACVGILVADVMVSGMNGTPNKGELARVDGVTIHNGGNAMTAAINLTKLGVETRMVGKVGCDLFGQFLEEKLNTYGVDTRGLAKDENKNSSVSIVLLDNSGERSFLHTVGTNGTFSESDIDYSIIDECDLVFLTGTYLMDTFDGAETALFLKKCKEMGKTTFLDVCWDAKGRWAEVLDSAMPYIDYFMPSIDEAVNIAGCDGLEGMADVFMSKGVKNVVIKTGKTGSYMRLDGESVGKTYPSLKGVTAIDTTGAGDSFCSGFLSAFARDLSPEECIRVGNTTGAMCVTAKGATTGIRSFEQTLEFMNAHA